MIKKNEGAAARFVRTSGVFFIGAVLSKGIQILLLPLYTSHIPTSDMGYYDLSITYITIAMSALFFDIWSTVLRYVYDRKNNAAKASCAKGGWIIFGMSSAVYMLVCLMAGALYKIEYLPLIMCYGLFGNIASMISHIARGTGKNIDFAVSGILNAVLTVVANIILILHFGIGIASMYLSYIAGCMVQILYLLFKADVLPFMRAGRVNMAEVKEMFHYTLPLCVNSVAYWLLTGFNRVVINSVYNMSANGIYAIGNKFSMMVGLATTSFTLAWQDMAFTKAGERGVDHGAFYSKASNMYIKFLFSALLAIMPLIKISFPILVGEAYSEAEKTVPLFLIVATISAVSSFVGNIFYAIKDTKTIFISMVISAAANLLICYPLIVWLGLDGANLAIAIAFAINLLIRNRILNKKIGFRFDAKLLIYLLLLAGSYIVYMYCSALMNGLSLSISCGIIVWGFRKELGRVGKYFAN